MKNILILAVFLFISQVCQAFDGYNSSFSGGSSAMRNYNVQYFSAAATSGRYSSQSSYNSYSVMKNSSYGGFSGGSGAKNIDNYNYGPSSGVSYGKSFHDYNYTAQKQAHSGDFAPSYTKNTESAQIKPAPFRYNSLDYTRVRKLDADPPKKYQARCTDIGDASFCR